MKINHQYRNKYPAFQTAVLSVVFVFIFECSSLPAAQLDNLYQTLIKQKQKLYTAQGRFFTMWEKGHHGSASFDYFGSNPHYSSLLNALRFAPAPGWDVQFGYQYTFPVRYDRPTGNSSDVITSYQRYFIDNLQDFTLNTRMRSGNAEYCLDVLEKRNRTRWNFATTQVVAPIFFNYFQSNYEDIKFGARTLNVSSPGADSLFTRPLLNMGELNTEWELGYKNGRMNRWGTFYLADTQQRYYQHRTHHHFIPGVLTRYGITPQLEVEGGFTYTSPFSYDYDFKQYKESGLTSFISGTYTWDNAFEIPFKARFRPTSNWEVMGGFDYKFAKQALNYWEKAENGTVTIYPTKKLRYFNFKPQLEVNFITTPAKILEPPEIAFLTKQLLSDNQWSVSLRLLKDLTSLKKNSANGAQNLVDPYNVYLYPVENFVSGTEYSAFFSGNAAVSPANVDPQDYLEASAALNYGISDRWEAGLAGGYRTENNLHQFSLNDKSDRYFIFKPYYYVDVTTNCNLTKDSLLSFKLHFVPDYKTILKATSNPETFTAQTRYLEAVVSFQRLF